MHCFMYLINYNGRLFILQYFIVKKFFTIIYVLIYIHLYN